MLKDSKSLRYIPALDGIRAFAVIIVILHHLFILKYFEYGWTGVQIFFVLSGFLITRILLDSKSADNYFSVFYIRRFLRIFPIYYLAIAIVIVVAYWSNESFKDFGYYLFYVQNFVIGLYSEEVNFPMMFNHTWSLAVEEQFYLVWPLVIWMIPDKDLWKLVTGVILIALFVKLYLALTSTATRFNYLNTISNLDTLAAGSLLAILLNKVAISKVLRISIVSTIIITSIYFSLIFSGVVDSFWSHSVELGSIDWVVFYIWLLPFIILLLLLVMIYENNFIKILLTNRIMLFIGKISYGLYLYHYIIYHLLEKFFPSLRHSFVPMAVYKIFISFAVASASWYLIENPVLSFKKYFKYNNKKQTALV